jgi:hypothetical protein
MNIFDSTLAQNFGIAASAIYNIAGGTVTIASSTVSGNLAAVNTNVPGAAIVNGGGTVRLENSIVAQNSSGSSNPIPWDCAGTITSLGNNLIGTLGGCTVALQNSDLTGDAGLGTFMDNGTP